MLTRLSPAQLPLLITGIAGVAGFNAFNYFRRLYGDQVVGVRPENNWPLSGPGIIGCDFERPGEIQKVIAERGIQSILNAGGSCRLKACELDPTMAQRVNVQGIENLLNAVDGSEIHLIHLSIDLVFSGKGDGGHVETDATDPVTVYGKTMVAAEQLVLARRPTSCILRISLPMGVSFNGHAGAIDWIQSRFAKDKPATLYFDEIRTPTYTDCLNEVIAEVFSRRISGLFHAGGQKRWSLYQIAQIVNRVGGYDPDWLHGCPRIDAGPVPPRAGDVTMNSDRLEQTLGRPPFALWPENQDYWPDSETWHFSRSDWTGSPELLEKMLYHRSVRQISG
jgi:dTDP-4-dehydrorhamnose reductase